MTPALCLLLGLAAGAAGVWLLQREELTYLRKELAIAQDRLLHAWREDKAVIAPRPVDLQPIEKLPPELQECVDEWESPEARVAEESRLRARLGAGWGVQAILREREDQHPS